MFKSPALTGHEAPMLQAFGSGNGKGTGMPKMIPKHLFESVLVSTSLNDLNNRNYLKINEFITRMWIIGLLDLNLSVIEADWPLMNVHGVAEHPSIST